MCNLVVTRQWRLNTFHLLIPFILQYKHTRNANIQTQRTKKWTQRSSLFYHRCYQFIVLFLGVHTCVLHMDIYNICICLLTLHIHWCFHPVFSQREYRNQFGSELAIFPTRFHQCHLHHCPSHKQTWHIYIRQYITFHTSVEHIHVIKWFVIMRNNVTQHFIWTHKIAKCIGYKNEIYTHFN